MKGYWGRILVVDLTTGECFFRGVDDFIYESVLSGVGLGAWYLNQNIPAGADPLGPDNILGITSGLLTGTGSVMTGRWMAVCKSPLTGGWGDSNCGGDLAPAIKQCGIDAIFFHGMADEPVYLYTNGREAEIRRADQYWGLDTVEVEKALIRDCRKKKKPAVAVIGPAGEKCSLISGISNDLGRFAARSGVGAVMGSKKLKAIVLDGSKRVEAENREDVKAISKEYARKVRKSNAPALLKGGIFPAMGKAMGSLKSVSPMDGLFTSMLLKKYGSIMNNTLSIHNGDAPIKNWSGSAKDYNRFFYKELNPEKFIKREERKYHCSSCIVGCGGICNIRDIRGGKFEHTHKPEYETAMMFGGLLMNRDTDSIFYINELLNRAGLDTISTGGSVAFAIECYMNGVLTAEETDGLELRWGDSETIVKLVEKIAKREPGIGDLLADGVKAAAEKIGKGSERFAVHAGGQELPAHDPKIDPMLGATYSADPTPGRHTTSGGQYYSMSFLWDRVSWLKPLKRSPKSDEYIPGVDEALKNVAYTSYKMLVDGAGGCYYAMLMGAQHFKIFEYLNAATGWKKSPDEYMEIGKRIQNLRQQFNAKQGVDVNGFKVHHRVSGREPLTSGHNKGITLDIDGLVGAYRKAWGWDAVSGYPLSETLDALGIPALLKKEAVHG
ncbi:MAG: aldehyde ferredoxin oxidoreductase family protein [Spirochaetales bacterium]|nr:aldehyde ferredoxin oxidoreductase family protein [Spirochaetales bacterium]